MGGVNDAVDQIDFRLNQYSTKFIQPSLIQNFLSETYTVLGVQVVGSELNFLSSIFCIWRPRPTI